MFKNARIGDKLYSVEDGWGVLEDITDRDHPLTIQFDSCRKSFTMNGRRYIDSKNPTLFWDKIEFEIPKRPLPNLKVGTEVFVWDGEGFPKRRRKFKKFTKKGRIVCFKESLAGVHKSTARWKYWEIIG